VSWYAACFGKERERIEKPISLKDTRNFQSFAAREKEHHMTEAKTYIAPSLLQPDNHAVLLIDYQYLQLVTACSHNPQGVIGSAVLLAGAAKLFKVPTLVTTGLTERQGLVREVAAVFPEQKPINRTSLNSFEDGRVADCVKKTGKKKLVMGGLWTESCLLMASLSALHAGYEVYILSHGGGFLPYAATRFAELEGSVAPGRNADELTAMVQSFYFDTASSAPSGFLSLLAFARRGHVVFGTDYPHASEAVSKKFTRNMDNYDQFREHELDEITQNALSFPRLNTHGTDVNESRNLAVTESATARLTSQLLPAIRSQSSARQLAS
jgi:hypothetical protein